MKRSKPHIYLKDGVWQFDRANIPSPLGTMHLSHERNNRSIVFCRRQNCDHPRSVRAYDWNVCPDCGKVWA